jgi:hypothetical protein
MAVDPETLTAEEIKAAYFAELNKEPETQSTTIYRRTLPDGRVVEAESPELLIDKIVATRPTQEVQEVRAQTEAELAAARQSDADSEFVLAQRFASNPSQALAESLGFETIEDARAALQKARNDAAAQAANREAEKFVAKTPEYAAIPANGSKIQALLKTYNLPCTVDNITRCYEELKTAGLLSAKPAPAGPTEDDLYKMPLEDLRKAAGGAPKNDVENTGWSF